MSGTLLGLRHTVINKIDLGLVFIYLVAQTVKKICLQCKTPEFDPWVRKVSQKREQQPTPVFFP